MRKLIIRHRILSLTLLFLLKQHDIAYAQEVTLLGFGSCNEPNTGHTSILSALLRSTDSIEGFIWLGDNVYLEPKDWKSYENVMEKYREVFGRTELRQFQNAVPQYAIWDDHDAGANNCDKRFKYLPATMRAFKDFWRPEYEFQHPDSYYGSYRIKSDVELFFLDNRTFRTAIKARKPTVLGHDQLQWLETAYRSSDARFKLILLGGQLVTPAAVFENMANYPEEQQRLIELFQKEKGIPVVLTGDRHHGEISRVPGTKVVLDVTASPLTAGAHPHHNEHNPYRTHLGTTDSQHFGILKLTSHPDGSSVVESWLINENGEVVFKHRETYDFEAISN